LFPSTIASQARRGLGKDSGWQGTLIMTRG
jgi:hypothetical protein